MLTFEWGQIGKNGSEFTVPSGAGPSYWKEGAKQLHLVWYVRQDGARYRGQCYQTVRNTK